MIALIGMTIERKVKSRRRNAAHQDEREDQGQMRLRRVVEVPGFGREPGHVRADPGHPPDGRRDDLVPELIQRSIRSESVPSPAIGMFTGPRCDQGTCRP